ncbi:MAG: ATP-binding cassette domain-containing protein, partial [Rhizobiales bacterium]|nr:ATP-binding cassette domain-containing protein [Hyphomicrobiales bacterium]
MRAATTFAARLTFEAVERTFDDTVALAGVSLDIAPGEVVCLLGPSGCGKTTLLRIAAGIERPTGGRVLVNDQEVAGPNRFVPPEERNVGLMFQDF